VKGNERGASIVEFAVVVPLFLLLVFGTIEAGWFFAQEVEIRNAAREGARLAVVDFGTGQAIRNETCARADLSGSGASVDIVLNGPSDPTFDPVSPSSITVTMTKNYQSITGFLDFAFGSAVMSSSAEMRTERPLVLLTSNSSGTCP
jgi:Flp pilus assembly protein TadG